MGALAGAEHEQALRHELTAALDRIAELEQSLADVHAAAELVTSATEQLAALSSTLDAGRPPAARRVENGGS